MLLNDPFHWFPDPYFSTVLLVLVFAVYLIDRLVPRALARSVGEAPVLVRDRHSFWIIQALGLAALAAAVAFRYWNWAVTPPFVQYAGLFLIAGGLALREWAIVRLGRFFSRTVEIETGHQLITTGPYQWIRHPAYTGMILIYLGLALSLGTWLGSIFTLVLMLAATAYRIHVEEQVLLENFGQVYRDYMQHTWRLLPGW
jgi:protein-S-isoprenylcysteine O-methyltransferase